MDNDFLEYFLNHGYKETTIKYKIGRATIRKLADKLGLPRKKCCWKDYKDTRLTKIQSDIIIGSLLGDGTLLKTNNTINSEFREVHSEKQKGWVEWKYNALLPFSTKVWHAKSIGKDVTKIYSQFGFKTMRHSIFTELEKKWYKRDNNGNYILKQLGKKQIRTKILPEDFLLTPLSLAVWFIDDGHNRASRKYCSLATNAFNKEEVIKLVDEIKKIGINDCKITKDHGNFSISINSNSYIDFIKLIKNNITNLPDDVQYKVNIKLDKNLLTI